MRAKIQKWGNSLGLRLPKLIANDAQLIEGSEVEITMDGTSVVISLAKKRKYNLSDLIKKYPKKKGKTKELDWGKATGREEW